MVDFKEIRKTTEGNVKTLGYKFNKSLPLLDDELKIRPFSEVCDRIMTLFACVSCSYGFPKKEAMKWLEKEDLIAKLSDDENYFLNDKTDKDKFFYQWQVECLWVMTWATGHHDKLSFSASCTNDFISIFPDIKNNQSADIFRENSKLRDANELLQMLDLAYCLHWSVVDAQLNNRELTGKLPFDIIQERCRGLEWLLSDVDWSEISLDT